MPVPSTRSVVDCGGLPVRGLRVDQVPGFRGDRGPGDVEPDTPRLVGPVLDTDEQGAVRSVVRDATRLEMTR